MKTPIVVLSLTMLFSLMLTQSVYAEKSVHVDQNCENTILKIFVTNQNSKPIKDPKIFDNIRKKLLASGNVDGVIILPANLQGDVLRVGSASYPLTTFTAEDCQPVEIKFEKSDSDLVIVSHHTWSNFDSSAEHGGGEYQYTNPTGNYIAGDIVNLSEHNLTDIKISIISSSERLGTVESTSIFPIKKILRPGEASPFFAYLQGGFSNYSIKIDDYKGTSAMPISPSVKISNVELNEDSNGNGILTIICADTLQKSNDFRLLLLGYSEDNFLESAMLFDAYLFSLSNHDASDCITDGKITLLESTNYGLYTASDFVEYAKNDRFEVFIIQSGLNLFYDVKEMNQLKNLNMYQKKPNHLSQNAVYSNYYPNSLTPKHIDANNLKLGLEKIQEDKDLISETDDVQQEFMGVSEEIPVWIKNNAGWWATDQINDDSFLQGIQFLIREEVITISAKTQTNTVESSETIPSWIKSNAQWWSEDLIDDEDFLTGIKYLLESGTITLGIDELLEPSEITRQINGEESISQLNIIQEYEKNLTVEKKTELKNKNSSESWYIVALTTNKGSSGWDVALRGSSQIGAPTHQLEGTTPAILPFKCEGSYSIRVGHYANDDNIDFIVEIFKNGIKTDAWRTQYYTDFDTMTGSC